MQRVDTLRVVSDCEILSPPNDFGEVDDAKKDDSSNLRYWKKYKSSDPKIYLIKAKKIL